MTPAAFDTRRRLLGLSIGEAAETCAVDEATVQSWQDGSLPIPEAAFETLEHLELVMAETVERMAEAATDLTEAGPVVLKRYRCQHDLDQTPWSMPLGAHAVMIAWTAQALEMDGIASRIEWTEVAD